LPLNLTITMSVINEVEDTLTKPVTAIFAFVGILYISLKIFSFWRLVASLFVLPGKSVRTQHIDSMLPH